MANNNRIQRRIGIMGFRSVGKSSLTIQFVENQFVDSYNPIIENTFLKKITINGQEYLLNLVDRAGQDEYTVIPSSYFVNIDGYVLVYSINSRKRVPVVLVGNKSDLKLERVVAYEEGKKVADSWKAPFLEASAKDNEHVPEIFQAIVIAIDKSLGPPPEKSGCIIS